MRRSALLALLCITTACARELHVPTKPAEKATGTEAPNLYTDFTLGDPAPYPSTEIFFRWEAAPSPMLLFQAFTFRFQADQGGYIGPQIVGSTRKVLFSIWDMHEGTSTAIPLGTCDRFSGEGTGARCLKDFNWGTEREYRLKVERYAVDDESAYWRGTIDDFVIGEIKLRNSAGYVGYGDLMNRMAVFLEFFGSNACGGQPHTRLVWRGPYTNGNAAVSAYIPFYRRCDRGNVSSPGPPITIHEAGAGVTTTVPAGVDPWTF